MYGERHPSQLSKDELPSLSSGDELESVTSASEISTASFTDAPRTRSRVSLRRQKLGEVNSAFRSDDELSTTSNAVKSQARGILKKSAEISDAESVATSSTFLQTGSRKSVRIDEPDKVKAGYIPPRKVTAYPDETEREDGGNKKKVKVSDPFEITGPAVMKPARNDPRRSSGRGNGSPGSQRGRQGRSSSTERCRQNQSNGSALRSRSVSPGRGQRSPSAERKKPSDQSNGQAKPQTEEYYTAVHGADVRIEMPSRTNKRSMMGEMLSQLRPTDNGAKTNVQKVRKWCLIIGVPVVIVVVVIAIVMFVLIG